MPLVARMTALLLIFLGTGACERDRAGSPERAADTATAPGTPAPPPGEAHYLSACAKCHEGTVPKAPHRMFLQMMAPDAILAAMNEGIMQAQAAALTDEQRIEVAEYLAGQTLAEARLAPQPPRCDGDSARFDLTAPPRTTGWGMTPENSRFIPEQAAGLAAADVPVLELKWAFAFPNAQRARSQPTVAFGAVFVGSHNGTVYALDRETGCVRWSYRASAEVRTPVIIGSESSASGGSGGPLAFFGDLLARVYALEATTGQLVWSMKADDHPNATITAAPVLHGDRLYVAVSSLEVTSAADPKYPCCTFRGSVLALDASSGSTLWKAYTIEEPPRQVGQTTVGTPIIAPSGAPVWNSPTLDLERGLLYVGTGENYSSPANDTSDALLAFRLTDGALIWHAQKTQGDAWNVACMMLDNPNCPAENGPDVDFGSSIILGRLEDGPSLLLAGQKSGDVYGVDPQARGRIVWHKKVGRGGIQGGVHFGMALANGRLFVPISDMANEFVEGKVYEEPARPGLYALDAASGRTLWSSPADDVCDGREFCEPGISAAITAIPGVVFAGHMDGRLRAYDAATGRVIWEYATAREFDTVGGIKAIGGSFGGGAGPVVDDGMLFAVSGYGIYYHMPGNVLLAFGIQDKR